MFYSGISILKELHHGSDVNWLGYAYRFVIGKSATPFYYIIVLLQLTIITPWLVKVVKEHGITRKLLWLVTPVYLTYVYVWNFMTGSFPQLYETLFPAWFGFYYLGIHVRCGMKFKCSGKMVAGAWLLSCAEALSLRASGMSMGFYTSQITVGSFLFSASVIGWILEKKFGGQKFLSKVGDCSYGIFYIHMFVLMLVGRFVSFENWFAYWGIRFILTAAISFGIVCLGQRLLKKHGNLLKYIGFI